MAGQVSEAKERTISSEGVALCAALMLAIPLPAKKQGIITAGAIEKHLTAAYDSGAKAGYMQALKDCIETIHMLLPTEHISNAAYDAIVPAVRSLAKGKEGSNG